MPENVIAGEELSFATAPGHGDAGGGCWRLPAEPGLCLVVGLCNPATVQRTDDGCCIPSYSVIVQEICSFWLETWARGLPVSRSEKPTSPLPGLAHGRREILANCGGFQLTSASFKVPFFFTFNFICFILKCY